MMNDEFHGGEYSGSGYCVASFGLVKTSLYFPCVIPQESKPLDQSP
ncbi:hypothetical protein HMPREF0204_10001 [Chryseobacterium gleum ATCC 35910]|uniref:Uncharacterized protein n=1 Tax=Chryseobacterium gleum ATCC 35910 TaxID=525257 RepID=A0ABN0AYA8_CHRGE|nr:hypothetical protein HMPREF0204_10001 [Chryseobacterium gleum ATCC 35910]